MHQKKQFQFNRFILIKISFESIFKIKLILYYSNYTIIQLIIHFSFASSHEERTPTDKSLLSRDYVRHVDPSEV
jgi:hypothetical protein